MVDLMLPKMKGPELAERIRSMRPELRVLYAVNYSYPQTAEVVAAAGMPCIAWPFSSVQLTRSVRAVLDHPKATAAA